MRSKIVAYFLLNSLGMIANNVCSKTLFAPRSLTYNIMLQKSLTSYHIYHNALDYDHDVAAGIYIAPFYTMSLNPKQLASFFLPPHTNQLLVHEDGTGTIGSQWLGLQCGETNPFVSQLVINPEREVVGSYCSIFIPLSGYFPFFWMNISCTLMRVQNALNLKEQSDNECGECAKDAFNNPNWKFGKLSAISKKETGIDDIQVSSGYNWYWGDENHIGLYLLAGVPTGKKTKAEFLFEPIVGSRHASFGIGFVGDLGGWIADEQYLNVMIDGHYRYIFSEKSIRSFDLIPNGSWSRYLSIVKSSEDSANPQPGINYLTQEVTVRPNSRVQLWVALHYEVYKLNWEIGYNYWARTKETICNLCFDSEIAIWDSAVSKKNRAVSASNATIDQASFGLKKALSDELFTPISYNNFDLTSAEHPHASSHTIYAAFSYNGTIDNCPGLIGIGLSYEFAANNAALEQWMVWGKLGFVF